MRSSIKKRNPFSIGIVQADDFCNRTREIRELTQYARNGSNVVLFSPRRYGKSSLVTLIQKRLAREGYLTTYVDLFPITSKHDFIHRLATAIFKGIGKGADPRSSFDRLKGLFSRLRPSFSLSAEGPKVLVDIDRAVETPILLDDLMKGLGDYVKKNRLKACVVLDEFQEITELPETRDVEGILRSHIQFHKDISYFFVGSRRRVLQDIFSNKSRPFYKSVFLYPLPEIANEDFVPFIQARFKNSGKNCPPKVAAALYERVHGYPYYVQKLASIVWEKTQREATPGIIDQAHIALIQMETADFEAHWGGLSMVQKTLLKALATQPTKTPFAKTYLEQYRLSIGGAQKGIKALLAKDLIEEHEIGYRLTDPVMGSWLKGEGEWK